MAQRTDRIKARQAILYICHKMAGEDSFGSVVLNKIIYYIDHANYLHAGKTITGFRYVRQVNGPTPEPSEFLKIKSELLKSGDLRETDAMYFGRIQKKLIHLSACLPNLTCFSGDEVAVMDSMMECFRGVNAQSASEMSHQELSWQLAGQMEEMPHYTFLLSESDLNNEDIAWAKEIIQGHRGSLEQKTSTAI